MKGKGCGQSLKVAVSHSEKDGQAFMGVATDVGNGVCGSTVCNVVMQKFYLQFVTPLAASHSLIIRLESVVRDFVVTVKLGSWDPSVRRWAILKLTVTLMSCRKSAENSWRMQTMKELEKKNFFS